MALAEDRRTGRPPDVDAEQLIDELDMIGELLRLAVGPEGNPLPLTRLALRLVRGLLERLTVP